MEQLLQDYSNLAFTRRLYNVEPYKKEAEAIVLFAQGNIAIFDQTIFYGESGGQIYDTGRISLLGDNDNYNLVLSVQHRQGRKPISKDRDISIPDIEVETKILHFFDKPVNFKVGDVVSMNIDWERRYEIMKNHTLAHFFFYAIKNVYLKHYTPPFPLRGCNIDEHKASFSLDMKFSPEEWETIKQITVDTINFHHDIKMEKDEEYETVFYWKYDDIVIPCGGTHVSKTQEISDQIFFSKKNAGKQSSRIYISCNKI